MDGRNVKPRVNHIFESVTVKESEAVYIIQARHYRTDKKRNDQVD